ncbi:hypothetical protein ACTFIW_010290 [Dictyostelium discoideum]
MCYSFDLNSTIVDLNSPKSIYENFKNIYSKFKNSTELDFKNPDIIIINPNVYHSSFKLNDKATTSIIIYLGKIYQEMSVFIIDIKCYQLNILTNFKIIPKNIFQEPGSPTNY